ncbi:aminotransferase class IV [Frigoriflavimonas asaccharolytica]|uniref:Branched-chain amino acid aminotransferase n=1 Tax=Frigoriflavimonas asaccharolytica TaxID=2735899 RepID=A0A8J8G7B2_9FLAO|nr:aminotransferase class IV [Frigoriflavimonas asaccharolytica]NRS92636.1 branched-chain amino acid aminotransferase [Frigoriflavimonas asaccharolytica]
MHFNDFTFSSNDFSAENRAFLFGDSVQVTYFIRNSEFILAEDVYFFLMASMRKMRMKIPMEYTLDFFQELFQINVIEKGIENAFIHFLVFRNSESISLQNATISYHATVVNDEDVFSLKNPISLDMIKEIAVGNSLLSNIQVPCAENIYAEIYAKENELDDLILLNAQKRIARSIYGNLLLLKDNTIKIPKISEGAYISPLLESFVTFVHKNKLAEIEQAELIAFETQKSDEILMISDKKGIFPVSKIRNKSFTNERFSEMIDQWKQTFLK